MKYKITQIIKWIGNYKNCWCSYYDGMGYLSGLGFSVKIKESSIFGIDFIEDIRIDYESYRVQRVVKNMIEQGAICEGEKKIIVNNENDDVFYE